MKIFCIGKNYAEHAAEMGGFVPDQPMIFMKPSTALLLENKAFYYPTFTKNLHYEGEIVLKIKKNGRHIQPEFASDYYDHIAFGFDLTARDLQDECKKKGHPWEIAKAFDHSAPLGNFVSVHDYDIHNISFTTQLNGVVVQEGNTADLIFDFNYLICYISRFFQFQTGDLIYTGTPSGVGPLKIGDVLEGFIGEKKMLSCEIK
ncbi:MAG TPA: fumarylacetoacetate hydrolase family protein [Saprospiraceae bacterium]|nr:fumarylacetoacetate hydrolase family protein [Saprospiraceae bacterium]